MVLVVCAPCGYLFETSNETWKVINIFSNSSNFGSLLSDVTIDFVIISNPIFPLFVDFCFHNPDKIQNIRQIIYIDNESSDKEVKEIEQCYNIFGTEIIHKENLSDAHDIENYCRKIFLQKIGFKLDDYQVTLLSDHNNLYPKQPRQVVSLFYAGNFAPVHSNHVVLIDIAVCVLKKLGYIVRQCIIYVGSDHYCENKLNVSLDQKDRCMLIEKAVKSCETSCVIELGKTEDSFEDVSQRPNYLSGTLGHEVFNLVGGDSFCYQDPKYGRSICINDFYRSTTKPCDTLRSDVLLLFADLPLFSSTRFRKQLKKREQVNEDIKQNCNSYVPKKVLQSITKNGLFPQLLSQSP